MIIASFGALSSPATAGDDFIVLREISQTHCQLLQSAALKPAPQLKQRIKELENTPDEFSLKTQYENAPDFSFLLPNHWQVMSWAQRVIFNHSFAAMVKRRLKIPQKKVIDGDCLPEIRIIEHPDQQEDNLTENDLPKPERLQAIVLMTMRGAKNSKIPLTYIFDKQWNVGWQLDDIIVHTTSIKEQDSQNLEQIISTSGIDELESYLTQLLNKE